MGDAFEIIPKILKALNEKIKLDILGLSSSVDSQTGSFALVLKENKGDGLPSSSECLKLNQ